MRPDPTTQTVGRATHRLTTAVAAVAMMTAVTAIGSGEMRPTALLATLVGSVAVTILAGWLGGRVSPPAIAKAAAPLVGLAYVGSFAAEPLVRLGGYGRPLELILFEGLLATLPALTFAGRLRKWSPLCGSASLFAVLFAACLLGSGTVAVLSAGWAVLAAVWLSVFAKDSAGGVAMTDERSSLAWVPVGLVALLAAAVAASTAGRDSLSMTGGFLASSGGDGDSSDYARDGVGDGNALVAATTHAESFGPVEDAPFARSDEPSLYDMFDDTFGEPQPPPTKQDRAISLAPEDVLAGEKEMAEAQAAGREFSTLRKPRTADRGGVDDLSSTAAFYVAGRVPLHLRVQSLESFDGVTWRTSAWQQNRRREAQLTDKGGKPWLLAATPSTALDRLFSEPEAHALKPVHYDGSRIPSPPNLTGVHIDRIDRADFYEWAEQDAPRLRRDRLAKLVPVHISSRRLDEDRIDTELHAVATGGRHELHALPPREASKRIRRLASEWAAGTESGWGQVRQVLAKLREHAVLDRDAVAEADSDFPAADFLFNTKRGPEYQFATAGCLLLRSLGYPTRLATGYYANPEKFDFAGGHTPVEGEDAHVWCEVKLSVNLWAAVDPSPGYVVLGPPRSLWYRFCRAAEAARAWAVSMWPVWVVAAACGGLCWLRRVEVSDAMRTLRWRVRGRGGVAAWRLLSRRLDAVQQPPPGWTARRRISGLTAPADVKEALADLAGRAEAGLFDVAGPANVDVRPDPGAPAVCGEQSNCGPVVRQVTLRRLRRWKRDGAASASAGRETEL